MSGLLVQYNFSPYPWILNPLLHNELQKHYLMARIEVLYGASISTGDVANMTAREHQEEKGK